MAVQASPPIPLLKTKLFMPRIQHNLVVRPQLLQRLDAGLHRKLTLISAPAGFGKTTAVSAWIAASERPGAWLSLDEGDGDPTRFLTYLISALQTIMTSIGEGVLNVLQAPQPPPIAAILTALINEITTVSDNVTLVLDDYHLVDSEPVNQALTFLIEHLPAQLHLILTTRHDPQLPLARLRARGQLTELRAADLRFTSSEAAEFLNQRMGLTLSLADVAVLETRTEGWIAGLQLAALALQGHQDGPGFIRTFAGEHRYIIDYLVDEVLEQQPAAVRSFLLQTAMLDRLHGPLCDAVTGQVGGAAQLETLERGNVFVVALDDQRRWYRYHHLFADVLRAHLQAEQSEQVATLHLRASAWHERHGSVADAVRHALAAGDGARAADLIERALPALRRNRLGVTVLGWLKALPDDLIRRRPVLSVAYATALMAGGELEGVEGRLRDAERWLDTTADMREQPGLPATETRPEDGRGMVVVDNEEFRRLPSLIAVYRSAHAQMLGNVADTETYARMALDLVPEDDHLARGGAAALLGLASWANGDLEAAHRHYTAGMASLQRAGLLSDVIICAITVANIRLAQGRLRDVQRTLEQAVQGAVELGEPSLHGTVDVLVGLSELRRERNDLHAAIQHLLEGQELAIRTGVSHDRPRWYVAMARTREAEGDLDGALDLLDEAERLYVRDFAPNVRPVAAQKARVWIAQGRLGDALGWAREQGLSATADLSYLREFEHITLARLLLARDTSDRARRASHEAMGLLERLLHAAEAGGRMGSVIEILALQALALQTHGDIPAALVPLNRALTLAEPEGYVRIFVDEGPPMAALLEAGAQHGLAPSYVRQLLAAFGTAEDSSPATAKQDLIEPLSERELDVLRLLGSDLDGPDIAYELNVTLNTMRSHTKNIYSKLGVTNRRAAVRRAEELKLLSRTSTRTHQSRPVVVHGA